MWIIKKMKIVFCCVVFQTGVVVLQPCSQTCALPSLVQRWIPAQVQPGRNTQLLFYSRDFGNGAAALGERPLWATLQLGGCPHHHHPSTQQLLVPTPVVAWRYAHLLFRLPLFFFSNKILIFFRNKTFFFQWLPPLFILNDFLDMYIFSCYQIKQCYFQIDDVGDLLTFSFFFQCKHIEPLVFTTQFIIDSGTAKSFFSQISAAILLFSPALLRQTDVETKRLWNQRKMFYFNFFVIDQV